MKKNNEIQSANSSGRMAPRPFRALNVSAVCASWLLSISFLFPVTADDLPERPNLIFILADDLGYGDLASFGQEHIRTPRLDEMAGQGMRLTDFYSGGTTCAPARSVLMTGQHTGRTLIRGNTPAVGGVEGIGAGRSRLPLREEDVTLAELLQEAGYVTAMLGKWGLGEPGTTGTPNRKGFDYFFGFLNQNRAHAYHPEFIWRNHTRYDLPGNWEGARGQYTEDLFASEAMTFIREQAETGEPFFLYLPHQVPHSEMWVPDEAMEPYQDYFDHEVAVYAGMVSRLDRNTGALLDLLVELDLAENTLVIFTSDNGTHSEGGYDPGPLNSSGSLRGRKRDLYEGGIRVPTIAWWPGKIEAGSVSGRVADFADVMPTFAQLAGVETPEKIDGITFLPTLLGRSDEQQSRPLYWEFHERGFDQAIRLGDWKAVRKWGESLELYNLATDIGETTDVASDHPERVEMFETMLIEMRTPSLYWPSPMDEMAEDSVSESEFSLIRHTVDDTLEEGDGLSLADLDGDGQNNPIVGTGDGGEVFWYEKVSPQEWIRHKIVDGYQEIEGTAVADFNGDGVKEIIIFEQATNRRNSPGRVDIAKPVGDPRHAWEVVTIDAHAPHAQQGIIRDVSGNGRPDIIYAYEGQSNDLETGGFYWLELTGDDPMNDGAWIKHEIEQISGAWWIDFNGPRDLTGNGVAGDIVVSIRTGRGAQTQGELACYLRPEDPRSGPWERVTLETEFTPLHVSTADLSGNGDPRDIATGGSHDGGQGLYWYEFNPQTTTWERHTIEPDGDWWGTYAFDINQSGRAEIITGRRSSANPFRIYAFDEQTGNFEIAAETVFHKPDDQIIFDDITGNGLKTGFFVGQDPGGLFWFETLP